MTGAGMFLTGMCAAAAGLRAASALALFGLVLFPEAAFGSRTPETDAGKGPGRTRREARRRERRTALLVFLMLYAAGCCCFMLQDARARGGAASVSGRGTAWEGVVVAAEKRQASVRLTVRLTGAGREVSRARLARLFRKPYPPDRVLVLVYRTDGQPVRFIGRKVRFYAALRAPDAARNPGGYDDRRSLLAKRIPFRAETPVIRDLGDAGGAEGILLRGKRRLAAARERFLSAVPADRRERQLLRGVLFGDTGAMDEDLKNDFRDTGTAHILAVSGLHIGVLYALARALARRFGPKGIMPLFFMTLFLYGTMAAWTDPVRRAALMASLSALGNALDRRYDLLTALALSAAGNALLCPAVVFSVSFRLSYLAAASMAVFGKRLAEKMDGRAARMIAVQGGILPYVVSVFHRVPLLTFLANPPVIFLVSLLVPVGIAAFLQTEIAGAAGADPSGTLLMRAAAGLSGMIVQAGRILRFGGRFTPDAVPLPASVLLSGYALAFYLSSERAETARIRKEHGSVRRAAALALAAGLVLTSGRWNAETYRRADVVFVDVGQGSCLFFQTPENRTILIDGGGSDRFRVGEKTLRPFLLQMGVRRVDLACATHLDTDHYRGLEELKACGMIGTLVTNRSGYEAGDVLYREKGFRIRVVAPLPGPEAGSGTGRERTAGFAEGEENERSLVLRIDAGDLSILATGDIGAETEAALEERYRGTRFLDCDILAVPHHGSRYSSSEAFIRAVSPELAVIQVGRNHYGHPAKETLKRYRRAGVPVLRTDRCGAVAIFRNGRVRTMITERG